jgi:phenylpropionate dioxygenase-like ring-hydroxylating dioxygenase large terminal subunit
MQAGGRMLSAADNEILTKVGPDTPMGNLFRRYWQPVIFSRELPLKNAPPVRVRLLGEDLLAFRDSNGNVGLMEPFCPHRGASLFYGRSEAGGLRCIYHGWKFDVTGACVEMANESDQQPRSNVRAKAYPCVEFGEVIWTYMGSDPQPALPAMEWSRVPPDHQFITKRLHECNWAQCLEGDLDSSHVGLLHSKLNRDVPGFNSTARSGGSYQTLGKYLQPHIEVEQSDFGLWVAARRPSRDAHFYWRITAMMLPYYTIIPASGDNPLHVNIWQPVDDNTTLVWSIQYHGVRPIDDEERTRLGCGEYEHCSPDDLLPTSAEPNGAWRTRANRSNDFFIDRDAQRRTSFSGLRGFWRQDRAVIESMGPISDRSKEHLGMSDVGVVRFRRMMLRVARAHTANNASPPGLDPVSQRVRATAMILPESASWRSVLQERATATPGAWIEAP